MFLKLSCTCAVVHNITKMHRIHTELLLSSEQLIQPEQFAEILCDDLDLNPVNFIPAIASAIKQQLSSGTSTEPDPGSTDQRVVIKVSRCSR